MVLLGDHIADPLGVVVIVLLEVRPSGDGILDLQELQGHGALVGNGGVLHIVQHHPVEANRAKAAFDDVDPGGVDVAEGLALALLKSVGLTPHLHDGLVAEATIDSQEDEPHGITNVKDLEDQGGLILPPVLGSHLAEGDVDLYVVYSLAALEELV